MKADHRKHLEQNELAGRLARWWKGTGESRTSSTTWGIVGAALLIVVLVIAWRYYSESDSRAQAKVWPQLDGSPSESDLKSIVESNRGTPVGRIAKAQLARVQLNDGLNKLCSRDERSKAIASVEDARTAYRELINDAKDDVLLEREAMLSVAQAEEALVGIPKSDSPTESRGSLDKALELYEQAAQKFDKTPQGTVAAARAKDIRENKAKIQQMYDELNQRFAAVGSTPNPTEPPLGSYPGDPASIPSYGSEPAPSKSNEPIKPLDVPPGEPATKSQPATESKPLAPPPGTPKEDKTTEKKPTEPLAPPPATNKKPSSEKPDPSKSEKPANSDAKPDQPKSDKPEKSNGV
jgi:hypothetical protein